MSELAGCSHIEEKESSMGNMYYTCIEKCTSSVSHILPTQIHGQNHPGHVSCINHLKFGNS